MTPIELLAFGAGKMAFVSGPRQCGKTTLAKMLIAKRGAGRYGNWDDIEFRRVWVKAPKDLLGVDASFSRARARKPVIAFDEIHKAKGWKRTLKGLYDTMDAPRDLVVTGSARLSVYKRGGDSLLGRYLNFRLHPFSLAEYSGLKPNGPDDALRSILDSPDTNSARRMRARDKELVALMEFGGFPEPLLRQSVPYARIWRRGRSEKIVREDLRDLSRIPQLSQVEMLMALLPERAAQRLSLQSLREDLEVAHDTVKRWMLYLADLYYCFVVRPYVKSIPRSLKKDGKLYLWDWSEVPNKGARFENLVACHLLKACHYWTDTGEGTFELHYLRDKEGREIDFVISRDRQPWLAFECKSGDTAVDVRTAALLQNLGCKVLVYVVNRPNVFRVVELPGSNTPTRVISAADVLRWLP